jgi:hypothetical protein
MAEIVPTKIYDDDGVRLLFTEDIAEKAGVKEATVRSYNAAARRNRRNRKPRPFDMPPATRRVRRGFVKGDGQPLVVQTPVWREDTIDAWLASRRSPGGRATA